MRVLSSCLAVLSLFAPSASADTLYVDAHLASGTNDGSSWANAFQGTIGLQSALAEAGSGDRVFVTAGTYKPSAVQDRLASFVLKSGVAIYGSFSGGESELEDRPAFPSPTSILSGDFLDDDGPPGTGSDNSIHVIVAAGVDENTIVDGFVISSGRANSLGEDQRRGAGAFVRAGAEVTFSRCLFRDHFSSQGGAVYVGWDGPASPRFLECRFEDNTGGIGGAIRSVQGSEIRIDRCAFMRNASFGPGALDLGEGSAGYLTNSVFFDNVTTGGEGIVWVHASSSMTLSNLTVVGNRAINDQNAGLDTSGFTSMVATNCILWGNDGTFGNPNVSNAFTVTYSIVQGGFSGSTNLDVDPLFVSLPEGDLRLLPGSPALDSGDNEGLPSDLVLDLAGAARYQDDPTVADTGSGSGPIVDMGAFEGPLTPAEVFCVGDGSGTACPCQAGASDAGCANSLGLGARLLSTGTASVSANEWPSSPPACRLPSRSSCSGERSPLPEGRGWPLATGCDASVEKSLVSASARPTTPVSPSGQRDPSSAGRREARSTSKLGTGILPVPVEGASI